MDTLFCLGQRHLGYLKQYCKVTYTNLVTSGREKSLLLLFLEEFYEYKEKPIDKIVLRKYN